VIRPGRGVRVVFLDIDDTLVDYRTASRSAFHAVLGAEADYDAFITQPHYERYLAGELGFDEMRDLRMADYLRAIGRDADAADAPELERRRFDGLVPLCRLFPDAEPLLLELRRRDLLIGLITNNEPVHQWAKIRAVGLDTMVDAIAISGSVGWPKPDKHIFDFACDQLDVESDQAIHVGDNLHADAVGALGAGIGAVWLDRDNRRTQVDVPDGITVISGLNEVAPLLD